MQSNLCLFNNLVSHFQMQITPIPMMWFTCQMGIDITRRWHSVSSWYYCLTTSGICNWSWPEVLSAWTCTFHPWLPGFPPDVSLLFCFSNTCWDYYETLLLWIVRRWKNQELFEGMCKTTVCSKLSGGIASLLVPSQVCWTE